LRVSLWSFNALQLGQSFGGAAHTTVTRYVDVLVNAMMVRRLEPHLANVGKRLVKSPKVYLRHSGLLHALLGSSTATELQGHPIAGASWEGSSWSRLQRWRRRLAARFLSNGVRRRDRRGVDNRLAPHRL
jgi:predicted AAA+ superfamily ATPase